MKELEVAIERLRIYGLPSTSPMRISDDAPAIRLSTTTLLSHCQGFKPSGASILTEVPLTSEPSVAVLVRSLNPQVVPRQGLTG